MAWLPIRFDLPDDPAVIGISDETGLDQDTVVGKLIRVWSWANSQSRDGHAPSVTHLWVDRHVRHEGFAKAMENVGWIVFENGGATIPNWDNWNSKSAKNRLGATKRQASKRAKYVTQMSRKRRDKSVTREEKRREELKKMSTSSSAAEPREKNPWWDAIVAEWGIKPNTKRDRTRIGSLARDFKLKGPAEEIAARRKRYRIVFQGMADTPEAVLKHYDALEPKRGIGGRIL